METTHNKEENKKLKSTITECRDRLGDLDAKNNQLQRELDALRREKEERERQLEAENNELKMEVIKLRAEMEAILRELQSIMDSKLGLELEIAAYRKLLEGEESRIGLKSLVDEFSTGFDQQIQAETAQKAQVTYSSYAGVGGSATAATSYGSNSSSALTADSSMRMSQVVKGEMSAKTTYQRSAKGPLSISECSADGKFITVENTGKRDEELNGWKLVRNIDGQERPEFLFNNITLQPLQKLKIWAAGSKPSNAAPTDLEYWESSWGTGTSVITKLINQADEDKATHVQKTVYS